MNQNIEPPPLNIPTILQAFQILITPSMPKPQIESADTYITQCESNPTFPQTLLQIFSQCQPQHQQTKQQILIHLKNVIARNWTAKRRTAVGGPIDVRVKDEIRRDLVTVYRGNWDMYYREFNQVFRIVGREDFPHNYGEMNQFVKQVLSGLASYTIDQILQSKQLLPYLSLIKILYKQYSKRRMLHTVANFTKYCSPTLQTSKQILVKINQALEIIQNDPQKIPVQVVRRLLECSRKIDKIVLYCLMGMVGDMQYWGQVQGQTEGEGEKWDIGEIVGFEIAKVKGLIAMLRPEWQQQIQLNIQAILQLLSKLQSHFPLLFTPHLPTHLPLLLHLLTSNPCPFHNVRLLNTVIEANTTPLTCFPYYMSTTEFKSSLEFKKNYYEEVCLRAQARCCEVFMGVYGGNVGGVLEGVVGGEVMVGCQRGVDDDQIIFEDAEQQHDINSQQPTLHLLLTFLKTLLQKFQPTSKPFLSKVLTYLLTTPMSQPPSKIMMNMYEVVLLLPKIMQENQENQENGENGLKNGEGIVVDVGTVIGLMERTYGSGNYDLFCRLVRGFLGRFGHDEKVKCFQILCDIITNPNVSQHTVYQSLTCLRKLLQCPQSPNYPLPKITPCLTRIFSLLQTYLQNPSHLWNLLHLLLQILKVLNTETTVQNLGYINQCVAVLVQKKAKDNLVMCALGDLLGCLLGILEGVAGGVKGRMELGRISMGVVCCQGQDQQGLTESSKYSLWLSVMKNMNASQCPQQMKHLLLQTLQSQKQPLLQTHPNIFFQLLQQYLLSNLLTPSSQTLLTFHQTLLQSLQPDTQICTLFAYFSLCLSYCLHTGDYEMGILYVCFGKLKELYGRVSPSVNGLRMLLMVVIGNFVGKFGGTVFQGFGQVWQDYRDWFWPYVWSLQYISNKYAAKVTAIAILKSFQHLKQAFLHKIEQNLPFDHILKFLTTHIQPLDPTQTLTTYQSTLQIFSQQSTTTSSSSTTISRRTKLHVNTSWCELDLSEPYRTHLLALFGEWDWGVDDLEDRYTKTVVDRVVGLLGWASGGNGQF